MRTPSRPSDPEVRVAIAGLTLLAASCMVPEEALHLDATGADEGRPRYGGFAVTPDRVAAPPVAAPPVPLDAHAHYEALPDPLGKPRRRNWQIMRDLVEDQLGWDPERPPCAEAPPRLPAVSADRRVVAVGLTVLDARGADATVRLLSIETGELLARYRLPRWRQRKPPTTDQACALAADVAQWLAPGGFSPLADAVWPQDELPRKVEPWAAVLSNAATREVDGGYDVTVLPATVLAERSIAVRKADADYGGDANAFVSDEVAVLTGYYVGC